jgi:hypothetical protein
MIARWAPLLLVVLAVQLARPTAGAPSPEPPLKPGTAWMYRYTVTPTSGAPRTGTLTLVYGGRTTYRGYSVYYTEESNTVTPGVVERAYYLWTDGHFRGTAQELRDAQHNVLEIVYDQTLPTDVSESLSGQAEVYQNGVFQAHVPWSVTVEDRGVVRVAVPAGTFRATRREWQIQLGTLQLASIHDSVGFTEVRVESTRYEGGGVTKTIRQELMSGPVQ